MSLTTDYERVRSQIRQAETQKKVADGMKGDFTDRLRAIRIQLFGPESLRATAIEVQCSAAFLSDLERGKRWSDEIVERYVKLLEAASK